MRSIDEFSSLLGDDLLTEEIDTDHDFVCGEKPANGEAKTCDDQRLLRKEHWGEGKVVERLDRWANGDGDLRRLSTLAEPENVCDKMTCGSAAMSNAKRNRIPFLDSGATIKPWQEH